MRDAQLIETRTAGQFALRVADHSELRHLLDDGKITQYHFDAGAWLREIRWESGADGYGVSWYECACTGGWRGARLEHLSERREHCWQRYSAALQSLPAACRQEVEAVVVLDRPV